MDRHGQTEGGGRDDDERVVDFEWEGGKAMIYRYILWWWWWGALLEASGLLCERALTMFEWVAGCSSVALYYFSLRMTALCKIFLSVDLTPDQWAQFYL